MAKIKLDYNLIHYQTAFCLIYLIPGFKKIIDGYSIGCLKKTSPYKYQLNKFIELQSKKPSEKVVVEDQKTGTIIEKGIIIVKLYYSKIELLCIFIYGHQTLKGGIYVLLNMEWMILVAWKDKPVFLEEDVKKLFSNKDGLTEEQVKQTLKELEA